MEKSKKIKIFSENKLSKILKIITLCFALILLLWFTLDMTGLRFGQTKIVTSAFIDEPIDFVFYILYIGCITFFILNDKIGKFILSGFIFLWGAIQYSMYFSSVDGIINYNKVFADTHHIIPSSQEILVKDTYHIFLDIFIMLALISVLTFMIAQLVIYIKNKKSI